MIFKKEDVRVGVLLELEEHLLGMQKADDGRPALRYVKDLTERLKSTGMSDLEIATICLNMVCNHYDDLVKRNFEAISVADNTKGVFNNPKM